MRILIDMNLSPRWVGFLVAAGHFAEHWINVGDARASDVEIMAHARAHGCVVLTHDLDFGAILAATQGLKPSVIQIRSADLDPGSIGTAVLALLVQVAGELEEGALVTLDPQGARIRLLPLG